MEDMGEGCARGTIMLGGGNPAQIPAINDYFSQLLLQMHQDGKLNEALCNYDGPRGKALLLEALATLLREELGWPVTPQNIALTNGSQSAFFTCLICSPAAAPTAKARAVRWRRNTSAMPMPGWRRICSSPPNPILNCCRKAKYHVDFDHLPLNDETGLICVSRPTNPTGNVITDDELLQLDALAQQHGVPLLIDNAYGVPFPGIIFSEARPLWNPNTILCMSLSKLGLPGARCGIIVADESTIGAIGNMNGIISRRGSIGPAIATEMIVRGDLLRLSQEVIKPFYQVKVSETIAIIRRYISEDRCLIHKPEGAIFLWLWFRDLPISTEALYQRLKARGVLMVPGHFFFPGLEQAGRTHQCMRMNYVPDSDKIERAVQILAEELDNAGTLNPRLTTAGTTAPAAELPVRLRHSSQNRR